MLTVFRPLRGRVYQGGPIAKLEQLQRLAAAGVPVVRAFAPPLDLLVASDEAIDDLVGTPASEMEYVEQANRWLREPAHP